MKKFIPVVAKPHTPPYKIHKYFARRPWNVFAQLIEVFSEEGQIIMDPFCGGGVTIYEGLKLKRKVIGFDINPLSIFIIRNMIEKSIDLNTLDSYYKKICDYLNYLYSDSDKIKDEPQDQLSLYSQHLRKILWHELAYTINCPYCGQILLLANENKISNGRFSCTNESCKGSKNKGGFIDSSKCKRLGYEYIFSVVKSTSLKKAYDMVMIDKENKETIANHVIFLQSECTKNNVEVENDEIPLNWDRQNEDLLFKKGFINFQDLFTRRNLLINTLLLNYINRLKLIEPDERVINFFRLVFSSSLRDTNVMSFTNPAWQGGKPTTWSKHAYWTPTQFCELNILSAFQQAYKRMKDSILYNQGADYSISYSTEVCDLLDNKNIFLKANSIDSVDIPENFLDAIITDPPYGSNVQYLELSHFWFPWNKDLYDSDSGPNFAKEAVANRKNNFEGSKDFKDYEKNLFVVFNQCYKALKPEKNLVFTFNNKDIRAWLALLIATFRAGFVFESDGLIYQNGVENYKQTAHTKSIGSPYGDFIHVFKKPEYFNGLRDYHKDHADFFSDIDAIFSKYLWEIEKGIGDKNMLITHMFSEVIPVIQTFVQSTSYDLESSEIYNVFGKNYLDGLHKNE